MRIVLSVDMEGIAGIRDVRELLACRPEYWETGRAKLTDDVVAAATGLLDGGCDEVIVLDNHASGHRDNLLTDRLPPGVDVATWNVFDLPNIGIDGMLQVGYHPRRCVPGFAPHTYIPGLRLWLDDEEISESHGRAWAAHSALLGITGHENHRDTLGSLAETLFLTVQQGADPHHPQPIFDDPAESADALRSFAREAMRCITAAPRPTASVEATFTACLELPDEAQVQTMLGGGWVRTTDETFTVTLRSWGEAREPLAVAMNAAMGPFLGALTSLDLTSHDAMSRQSPRERDRLTTLFLEALDADAAKRT
jgi:hypothetical protein